MLVMYHDEECDEELSYTLELARIMKRALSVLMIYKRRVMERLEDYMVAVTFAEDGEFKTAKELIMDDLRRKGSDYDERLRIIRERCLSLGIELLNVNTFSDNILSAIRNVLKGDSSIDMVLLSPSITNDLHISTKGMQSLVKEISRPVVTMAKNIKEKTA